MGDTRFIPFYERVARAEDPTQAIRALSDEGVIAALAAASRSRDPFLSNVLATEAQNRMRRIRAALEHLGEGVCSVDLDERIVYVNPAARRLLGWNGGDPMGAPLHGAVHGYDGEGRPLPEGACLVEEAMRSGRPRHSESERFARADGSTFPVAYTVAPLVRDGDVEGAVLVFSDVTHRKRTEARLRESEARWRALSEAAFEGVLVHDGRHILDANRAAREMFRIRGDACDHLLFDLVAPAWHAYVQEHLAGPGPAVCCLECRRTDGTTFAAEAMSRVVPYHGREARVVAIRETRNPVSPPP